MEIEIPDEKKVKINHVGDIYRVMVEILKREERIGKNREHFWIVGLDADHVLLFVELAALGSGNMFIVDPKEVFQLSVNRQAHVVILVHNHPGQGNVKPSEEDKDVTDRLIHAGEVLNLAVMEHLIISEESYFSFAGTGLMAELGKSKKYAIYFIEEEKLLKQGEKKKTIEMAKSLKKQKVEISIIAKASGLSTEEIEKL